MHTSQRLGATRVQLGLRVVGAGLLIATGAIHLDLYLTGFKNIPTIGPLFLLQVIAAFGLAVLVLVRGGRLIAALGAGFAASTLGGYLLSIWFGLFGFREVRTTAGIVALQVDRGGHVLRSLALALGSAFHGRIGPRRPRHRLWRHADGPAAGWRARCGTHRRLFVMPASALLVAAVAGVVNGRRRHRLTAARYSRPPPSTA